MITYHLTRLSDGRILFSPTAEKGKLAPPSHTMPDENLAHWFVKGYHFARHPLVREYKVEIE